jgi:ubiquinone/menaquinone biosynthesis C-methylase UbiE
MEENSLVKSDIRKYWDWRSRTYGLDQDRSIQVADKWKTVMNELAETGHGRRALDIGTGTGQFAFYLAEQGFEVDGIDLSEKMIAWAREKAVQSRLEIDFKTGDAEYLDFEENTFDVVVSRNLLWTLPDPARAIREWHRVLKPDGRIIVSDGFWQNDTWKRLSRLFVKAFKGLFSEAGTLEAAFQNIRFYDTDRFGFNPYGDGKHFFIAYAMK